MYVNEYSATGISLLTQMRTTSVHGKLFSFSAFFLYRRRRRRSRYVCFHLNAVVAVESPHLKKNLFSCVLNDNNDDSRIKMKHFHSFTDYTNEKIYCI